MPKCIDYIYICSIIVTVIRITNKYTAPQRSAAALSMRIQALYM
nr:MAG TPA: hypothetical protein [Caudoviricetes sp.]